MAFNYRQFRHFVRDTLKEMDKVIPYSESALNLLLGSCAQETLFGTFLHQIDGPGEGPYSMEPNTEKDIWANWLMNRYQVRLALTRTCGVLSYRDHALPWNLKYATIMARIQYRRFKDPLPPANDPRALGAYWDIAYNRNPDKGTVEEFVGNYMHYCRG